MMSTLHSNRRQNKLRCTGTPAQHHRGFSVCTNELEGNPFYIGLSPRRNVGKRVHHETGSACRKSESRSWRADLRALKELAARLPPPPTNHRKCRFGSRVVPSHVAVAVIEHCRQARSSSRHQWTTKGVLWSGDA